MDVAVTEENRLNINISIYSKFIENIETMFC